MSDKITEHKYLHITIKDNDFIVPLKFVGDVLKRIFEYEKYYPTEYDIPYLKEYIMHILYGIYNVINKIRGSSDQYIIENICFFKPVIEIVNYSDIAQDNDQESIYIPLFDTKIIIR